MHADADVPLAVALTGPGGEALRVTGTVAAGRTCTAVVVRVPDVERWWPIGYGGQPLYAVRVEASVAGHVATWQSRVGFRTIELDTTPDAAGAPFVVRVNGERILVRGANWIPDHAFLTQVDRDRYARRVTDAVEANINLLRVWAEASTSPTTCTTWPTSRAC